jgi:UDP-glucose 4-epimerase
VSLIEAGHAPVVLDNVSKSRPSVIARIGEVTGAEPEFHQIDTRDRTAIASVASKGIDACIHFAALKAVEDSVRRPLEYYDNNVIGTIALVEALLEAGVETFIFSSSATVYGEPDTLPLTEDLPTGSATNPYGWTKIMMEQILRDLQAAYPQWSVSLLRYFNPVSAHPTGLLGEDPADTPTNLMPLGARVAGGLAPRVRVCGRRSRREQAFPSSLRRP